MSAAATAAGYLYASGRLRGRGSKEQGETEQRPQEKERPSARRQEPVREIRVAALPPPEQKPRRAPTIQYRTRRWKPAAA
ncbi:MAG: hypothetical protein M3544_06285 [Pseudomonadota bacterium]|nr:hypothetical protein [Pseudomonadota bacterium]